jgi:hypothetical protein
MAIKFFGFEFGEEETRETTSYLDVAKGPKRLIAKEEFDGTVAVEAGGVFGTYIDYSTTIKDENANIIQYRNMSLYPEVDAAIDEIVNASIIWGTDRRPVKIDLSEVPLSDQVKRKIHNSYDRILKLLDFNSKAYEIYRRWYVDGKLFYYIAIDEKNPKDGIQELIPLDPLKTKKIKNIEKQPASLETGMVSLIKNIEEFYLYSNTDKDSYLITPQQGIRIAKDAIGYVHSGIIDLNTKRVIGYLHKAIRPVNMLRQLEDALMVYRVARAPERRAFYVDVGQLPKQKAEQYLRDMMSRFRNKIVYNQSTGEIKDDKNHLSILEDYWIPRREGSRGTEISVLPGGQAMSQIEDVEYFKKKLYAALNVPISRLDSNSGFNMGRSTEISREEIKFFKFIERLRHQFSQIFLHLLRVELLLSGTLTEDDWNSIKYYFQFKFNTDNYFWDLKEAEILSERLKMAGAAESFVGKYFSQKYIQQRIMNFSDEELNKIQNEIKEEQMRAQAEQAILAQQQPMGSPPPPEEGAPPQ